MKDTIKDYLFIFTYHIVYIKPSTLNKKLLLRVTFTYHIVYIKPWENIKTDLIDVLFTYHIVYIKPFYFNACTKIH